MIKAWAFHNPRPKALFLAVVFAPPLAVAVHEVAALGNASYSVEGAAGLGLVLLLMEASIRWFSLPHLLISRVLLLFMDITVKAVVAGLGLSWLAFVALPDLSLGLAGAAVVGLCTAGVATAARTLVPLLREPRQSGGVLVIGREDLAGELSEALVADRPRTGFTGTVPVKESEAGGNELTLDPLQLKHLVRTRRISRIIVVEPDVDAREGIVAALLECRLLGVEVEDGSEVYQRLRGKLWLKALDPGRLVFSDGFRITPSYRFVKRVVDVICAVLVLVLAGPLMALIALVVKLESRGPALFRQERVGQFGKPFTLLKFRSMREDAEKGGPVWCKAQDDRVTRVGGFLRKYHLDELPQAWNVLRGDLSFVGPRPERPCFVDMLRKQIDWYDLRHYVQPGVTGWAQVCYPYADSVEDSYEKLQYDLYYAKKASLGLDLRILIKTAVVSIIGNGR